MATTSKDSPVKVIDYGDSVYPDRLRPGYFLPPPPKIWVIGNTSILQQKLLGFFCSARCPGDIILRTYDLARSWRETGVGVIGGFHAPMEKECLDLLLRGKQPLVISPARGIEKMRLPQKWRDPIAAGRLLVISPFSGKHHRPTVALGVERNALVATLADELFIAHAQSGGKTFDLARQALDKGEIIYTIDDPANLALLKLGVQPLSQQGGAGGIPGH